MRLFKSADPQDKYQQHDGWLYFPIFYVFCLLSTSSALWIVISTAVALLHSCQNFYPPEATWDFDSKWRNAASWETNCTEWALPALCMCVCDVCVCVCLCVWTLSFRGMSCTESYQGLKIHSIISPSQLPQITEQHDRRGCLSSCPSHLHFPPVLFVSLLLWSCLSVKKMFI